MKHQLLKKKQLKFNIMLTGILCGFIMSGCSNDNSYESIASSVMGQANGEVVAADRTEPVKEQEAMETTISGDAVVSEPATEAKNSKSETVYETAAVGKDSKVKENEILLVDFDKDHAFSYCNRPMCIASAPTNKIIFGIDFVNGVPRSDDDSIYLFKIATYEAEDGYDEKKPVAKAAKSNKVTIEIDYREEYLFAKFVPAIKYGGEYVALYDGQYITNPETYAINNSAYPKLGTKKGMLLDGVTVGSDQLRDLNVKRIVYNIPLSIIIGETENEAYPTIEYEYMGKTYYFNGYICMIYDSLFGYLTENGYHNTAIILNDWNTRNPEIIHPKSRNRTGRSMYYALNTEEEDGVRLMEATALFLARRYSSGEHGMVHDWVIANEINQQKVWNYMATSDLDYYVNAFEQSFRTFYNAIRSTYAHAHVYFSIDHDWNDNWGSNSSFFNGRDLVYKYNEIANRGGNYDWGLSIHPYPSPLPRVRFWTGQYNKTEEAAVVTPMNLSAITDVMKKDELLDTHSNVRNISVTELGFSSRPGERLQAAAFAYCYYIIEDNEYIDAFLINRETDDNESLRSGLALGLYNKDYSPKYIVNVFANIDSEAGEEYIPEMLEIIGADSLEEALEWAR